MMIQQGRVKFNSLHGDNVKITGGVSHSSEKSSSAEVKSVSFIMHVGLDSVSLSVMVGGRWESGNNPKGQTGCR